MQFTTTYRQTTRNRRRCMICSKLIQDGDLVFFKGPRGRQGKAVHDACRADTGGGWYARDCATTYVRGRFGEWNRVTDHALEELHLQERLRVDHARMYAEYKAAGWTPEMLDMFEASYRTR